MVSLYTGYQKTHLLMCHWDACEYPFSDSYNVGAHTRENETEFLDSTDLTG